MGANTALAHWMGGARLLGTSLMLAGCGESGSGDAGDHGDGSIATSGASGDSSSAASDTGSSSTGDTTTAPTGSTSGGTGGAANTAGATGASMTGSTSDAATNDGATTDGTSTDGSAGSGGTGQLPDNAPEPGNYGSDLETLPESNSEMAVAEVDGIIYVVGGYPSSRETQSTVMAYDPGDDRWAVVKSLPVPIHHPVAVGHGGLLYSLGGQTDAGDTDRTLVYDPALDDWNDLTPMPTARGAGASAVIGDVIYVVGGRPPAGNAFEAYDVIENDWAELRDLPTDFNERNHLAATAIGGKVYVAGGRYDGGSFSDPMTNALDVYDPSTNEWTRMADMLRPRGGVNGVAAYGCFYVWGGEGSNTGEPNNVFPDHDVYNPLTDRWTPLAPMPTPVHGVTGAAFVNGLIYMPGGGTQQGGSSGSNLFQVYNPDVRCE